jgi:hypothetical protein
LRAPFFFLAEVLGGPYVPTEYTEDVLETENEKKLSSEQRYPYVKYYGQPNNFMHDNEIGDFCSF